MSKKHAAKIFELLENDDDEAVQRLIDEGKAERYSASEFREDFRSDLQNDLAILEEIKKMWSSVRVKVEDYRRLADGFRERLKAVGGYGYVPEPILMRNTNNGPLYYLFFASPQRVAGEIMENIFGKYRRIL